MGAGADGDAVQLALEYLELWNERAFSRIPELVHPAFVMLDPFAPPRVSGVSGEVHGRDDLETFISEVVNGFPDFTVRVEAAARSDDRVLYFGTLSLSHEGPYFGIPATGRRAEVPYMGAITVVEKRVKIHEVFPPVLALAQQLRPRGVGLVRYAPRLIVAGVLYLGTRLWGRVGRR